MLRLATASSRVAVGRPSNARDQAARGTRLKRGCLSRLQIRINPSLTEAHGLSRLSYCNGRPPCRAILYFQVDPIRLTVKIMGFEHVHEHHGLDMHFHQVCIPSGGRLSASASPAARRTASSARTRSCPRRAATPELGFQKRTRFWRQGARSALSRTISI